MSIEPFKRIIWIVLDGMGFEHARRCREHGGTGTRRPGVIRHELRELATHGGAFAVRGRRREDDGL